MINDRKTRPANATTMADIAQLHEFEHGPGVWIWPAIVATLALSGIAGIAAQTCWPLLFLIWPMLGTLMFVLVLAFHDASHGRLHHVNWLNEAYGHLMGTIMLTPLQVYRHAHARHHAQLARPGDPELWPFNSPAVPRPLRVLAAFVEIILGAVYTPLLFLRSVLTGELNPRERRMIIRGYIACFCYWSVTVVVVTEFDLWAQFLAGMIVPTFIAGALQTLNKFEQHLGLHGRTVLGLTRTVVDRTRFAEMVSAAMLYNDYHGTHHRYAKIPYYHLPQATPFAVANATEFCPVYPSLLSATIDMLFCLTDPKAGPQWLEAAGQVPTIKAPHFITNAIEQPVFTGTYDGLASS